MISGGIQPLMEGRTARPLRYKPGTGEQAGEFVIRNGAEFFNRPIYGPPDTAGFRVDAGDKPEFSLYLPGHGGNLKLGFIVREQSKWGADADDVTARYRPGRMIYEMRDALLAKGMIRAELLTAGEGSGVLLKVEGSDLPANARLAWAFGGVSGRKGRRGGDIGCEVEPVSQFFQVRAEGCSGNTFETGGANGRTWARITAPSAVILLTLPGSSEPDEEMTLAEFSAWSAPPGGPGHVGPGMHEPEHPILRGSLLIGREPALLTIEHLPAAGEPKVSGTIAAFAARSSQVEAIAQSIKLDTPDEYINAAGPALAIAADGLWDSARGCIMHGAVAWRQAFAGWRGPYALDAMGTHDRAVANFRHWIAKQNTSPITTGDPATGPWDPDVHLTRKEKLLHSNGDVENSHYDMNMVLFDALLRHLMWTGDLDFAREVWPAVERHLAWEHRLFRRTYKNAKGEELPLYEAYAAIWASDNLQYSGGGAAHSSAYMVFALRSAAKLATLIGKDGGAYELEADLITRGMNELLWLPEQGAFGESKDLLGPQTVYSNPALWTVYHTIDSEVPTSQQAWLMAAERLAALKHVPIHGEGVPDGGYMLSCSDWLPYMWSLNLLLLAENMHFALALWQVGMREEAYRIFKGALLDSMYMGLCPGDLHMTSALDVHRQEAQRDFGDPTGITSRALIEGLFGIQPDLLAGEIRIRPGFPSDWNHASLMHKDFDFAWKREGMHETCEFTSRLPKPAALALVLPARTTSAPIVTSNGVRVPPSFANLSATSPMLELRLPAAATHQIRIDWHGRVPSTAPAHRVYRVGDALELPAGVTLKQISDPQKVLADGRIAKAGAHTLFAAIYEGERAWSMAIPFTARPASPQFLPVPMLPGGATTEPVDLSATLNSSLTQIFTRVYSEPRSPYCSLSFPDNLLGGWANPDGRATIDDAGLRAAGGLLKTAIGVDFATPAGDAPNCRFLSYWKQDEPSVNVALRGKAQGLYLLMAGTTMPQCSRMNHATVTVAYRDGSRASLPLRNPETWWPIEQDYLLDDYLFVNDAPLPPRVDLRSGQTRLLEAATFKGRGRNVPGGAATILHLPLDPAKELAAMEIKVELYGVVVALLGATLVRG
ncbi:MAG TPA: DUF4450 domain-containing protein [Acidobacteriaceae bacterium]|nr:DUF4450 domain-containing protein [Acidobacteriaceae bacterium]